MREIPLTQGRVALVDDEDFEMLSEHRWHVSGGYAAREVCSRGVRRKILMHRLILALSPGEIGDHINRKTLDNRRGNLRRATRQLNSVNTGLHPRNTSGFRGVMQRSRASGWIALICVMGKQRHLGTFGTPEDAARAYDVAALAAFGEFAHLNFPSKGGDANAR